MFHELMDPLLHPEPEVSKCQLLALTGYHPGLSLLLALSLSGVLSAHPSPKWPGVWWPLSPLYKGQKESH